jgi:hypothetical protein
MSFTTKSWACTTLAFLAWHISLSVDSTYMYPVKFTLEQVAKAEMGRPCITLLFLQPRPGWGGWSKPSSGRFTPGKDPVPIVWQVGWTPGPVGTGADLAPTGIRSQDRPARIESLYECAEVFISRSRPV